MPKKQLLPQRFTKQLPITKKPRRIALRGSVAGSHGAAALLAPSPCGRVTRRAQAQLPPFFGFFVAGVVDAGAPPSVEFMSRMARAAASASAACFFAALATLAWAAAT